MAKSLTQDEIKRICELYEQCGNYAIVAQLVGRSSTTVANVMKQANEARSVQKD